jgi:site-specific recombinase XerD
LYHSGSRGGSAHTLRAYASDLRRFLAYCGRLPSPPLEPRDLSRTHMRNFLSSLQEFAEVLRDDFSGKQLHGRILRASD